MIVQLDNRQFSESELFEIKIPLNLPYLTSRSNYERIDGEIEHNGVYYNYVERKVSDDTLYLKCRPNSTKANLYRSLNAHTSAVNDMPSNTRGSAKKLSLSYEYVQSHANILCAVESIKSKTRGASASSPIPVIFSADFFKPPRQIS